MTNFVSSLLKTTIIYVLATLYESRHLVRGSSICAVQVSSLCMKSISIPNLRGGVGIRKTRMQDPDQKSTVNSPNMLEQWLNLTRTQVPIKAWDHTSYSVDNTSQDVRRTVDHLSDDESSDETQNSKYQSTMLRFAGLILKDADACLRNGECEQAFEYYWKACKLWRKMTKIIPADVLMYYGEFFLSLACVLARPRACFHPSGRAGGWICPYAREAAWGGVGWRGGWTWGAWGSQRVMEKTRACGLRWSRTRAGPPAAAASRAWPAPPAMPVPALLAHAGWHPISCPANI
jgi:hypothetical protein